VDREGRIYVAPDRNEYRIEVFLIEWNDRQFVRISVQCYNTQADLDALYQALKVLLPQVQS